MNWNVEYNKHNPYLIERYGMLFDKEDYMKYLYKQVYITGSTLHSDLKKYNIEDRIVINYAYNPYILKIIKVLLKSQHMQYNVHQLEENYKNHLKFYKQEYSSENKVHDSKNTQSQSIGIDKEKASEYILYQFKQSRGSEFKSKYMSEKYDLKEHNELNDNIFYKWHSDSKEQELETLNRVYWADDKQKLNKKVYNLISEYNLIDIQSYNKETSYCRYIQKIYFKNVNTSLNKLKHMSNYIRKCVIFQLFKVIFYGKRAYYRAKPLLKLIKEYSIDSNTKSKVNVIAVNNSNLIALTILFGLSHPKDLPHLYNSLYLQVFSDEESNLDFVKMVWNNRRVKVISLSEFKRLVSEPILYYE